ncbi:methyltransferase domain-containing protein [Jatrophihabitans fulvus]
MPGHYDRCLGPSLFAPWAGVMSDAVAGYAPSDVLELAAGSGVLTAELVRRVPAARLVATDLNADMVSFGSSRVGAAEWTTADAQALPLPSDAFDVVACQFGWMFFPDRPAAVREAARVLRPGGHLVFCVWDDVAASPFPAALVAALHDLFGSQAPRFVEQVPHGYHDAGLIRSDVVAGGLECEQIRRHVVRGTAASADDLAVGFCLGTPLRFGLERLGPLDELTRAVGERMTHHLGPGRVTGDLAGLVVVAHRPDGVAPAG